MGGHTSREELRDLLERGRNVRKYGSPASSLEFFLRAARLAPDDDEVLAELQATREQVRMLLDVVESCDQDIAYTATNAKKLLELVHALTSLGRDKEAIAAAKQAVVVDPEDWEILFTLGDLLNNNLQYEAALAVFDRLIAVEPELSISWSFKAMVLRNLGRYQDILPVGYRAVTLDPNDAMGWMYVVLALSALGREEDADAARKQEQAARQECIDKYKDTD